VKINDTRVHGVLLLEPARFSDDRGWFAELWNAGRYEALGLRRAFVQTNVSCSRQGVLRGMHFQSPNPQGKLITVLSGAIFDVAVDLRPDSPTCGRWYGVELSAANGRQLWVPEGCAHGFLALADGTLVHYGCTAMYDPDAEQTLAWDDPDVGIAWPTVPGTISPKDRTGSSFADIMKRDSGTRPHGGSPHQHPAGMAGDKR
jgi:dTDP-4-dehydrorhamnose 3,5-epimerase